jgi:DNA-binding MarR family transcriptional regulator
MRRLIVEALSVHDAVAASLGISPVELRCLELLRLEPDASPSRLADRAGLTSGAVTGILDRLEAAGFVRREPDAADRRRILVRPVPERIAEIDAVYESFARRQSPSKADVEALAAAFATEAERLRVATDGGMLGDTYLAPMGEGPRARLIVATGAPRISFEASRFGQQVRMVAETAATRLRLGAAADRAELIFDRRSAEKHNRPASASRSAKNHFSKRGESRPTAGDFPDAAPDSGAGATPLRVSGCFDGPARAKLY